MILLGIMGGEGSFSEQAAHTYATKEGIREFTIVPLITAEAVLASLDSGAVDKAIFPVMNNNGGIVIEAMHAMSKYSFVIETMFEMDIHHMLLVHPEASKLDIHTITSHDQALKQCRGYLEENWPLAEILPYTDTAEAAKHVATGVLPKSTAAIASRRAGELYGLTVLAPSIQDVVHNRTTFLVATPCR